MTISTEIRKLDGDEQNEEENEGEVDPILDGAQSEISAMQGTPEQVVDNLLSKRSDITANAPSFQPVVEEE